MHNPRTDKRQFELQADGMIDADFARQLERELTAEQEKVKQLREALAECLALDELKLAVLERKTYKVGIATLRARVEKCRAILEKTK